MKRLLSLLLCVVLATLWLPACAQTDDVQAYDLTLSFRMDATAFPAEQQVLLTGLADLLNAAEIRAGLTWRGDLLSQDTSFDTDVRFSLGDQADLVSLRLWGTPDHIALTSPLLGDQTLMLNMLAWLEFAMKAYNHMELPLQNVALLTSTYAHASAFSGLIDCFRAGTAGTGSRTISREDCLALAQSLAETAQSDRAFTMWLSALLLEAGYSDAVLESIALLPDWADSFLDEAGIEIAVADDGETWRTGDTVLLSRTGDAWTLTLPPTLDGYTATVSATSGGGSATLSVVFALDGEEEVLNLAVAAQDLPRADVASGTPDVRVDLTGEMLPEKHLHFTGVWSRDDAGAYPAYSFTCAMVNPDTGAEQLAVIGLADGKAPAVDPTYTGAEIDQSGVNLFSVYEDTLSSLLHAVAEPFARGILPLLVAMPASTYSSFFGLMDAYGVWDILVDGIE